MKNCFLLIFFCFACRNDNRLEQALTLAGDNRAELEKVLLYYSVNPEDSLKYRAAVYLIENMPYHYSYSSESIDKFTKEVILYASKHEYPQTEHTRNVSTTYFNDTFPNLYPEEETIVSDLQAVTADYLIENIEHSFKTWQGQSWRKDVSFNVFCEYILPYRVADEPIQSWRKKYYDYYKPVQDSLCGENANIKDVSIAIYNYIQDRQRWIFNDFATSKYTGAAIGFTIVLAVAKNGLLLTKTTGKRGGK